MGLTAASVPKLPTDAADAMAPALTEPVTQSDISGQSPRPGDSITTHALTTTTAVTDSATENHQPNLNNGASKYVILNTTREIRRQSATTLKAKQQIALIEESLPVTTDDKQKRRRSAHMDQKGSSTNATDNDAAVEDQRVLTTPPRQDDNLAPAEVTDSPSMGLSKEFGKDVADVEQMLGDLASSGDIDLLSVLKTLDSAPVADGGFDLAGSLFNDVVAMNEYEDVQSSPPGKEQEVLEMHDEIEKNQQQMQRKCDFLLRRLRKLQARYMLRHASEEIAGLVEQSQRIVKRKDREKDEKRSMPEETPAALASDVLPYQPPPTTPEQDSKQRPVTGPAMRSFIKRLEVTATHQRATTSKRHMSARYFSSASQELLLSTPSTSKTIAQSLVTVPRFEDKLIEQIDQVSGLLHAEMRIVEKALDSEATASSSGGESADEMIPYTNQQQEHLYIEKRAGWRWACDRSKIASKWTWLLAQISDLEYRIRQHSELYQQIKKSKGSVVLEGEDPQMPPEPQPQSVNGFRGVLPGGSKPVEDADGESDTNTTQSSCRTRPYQRATFRKRKLLQTSNLHTISKKAVRSSTVKCGCHLPTRSCALCTGRSDPTAPRDLTETMPVSERLALLDPCYHPVLSFKEDASHAVHFEAIMQSAEWQGRAMRFTSKAAMRAAERMSHMGDGTTQRANKKQRIEDDRRPKSMKKLFGERKKYKKRLGLVTGKYRKNNKNNKNSNSRVKLSQLFGKNNNKLKNNNARNTKKNKPKSSHPDGHKSVNASNKSGPSTFVNSYLQHLDMESGGSGNTSGRSINASPVMGQPKSERPSTEHRRSRTSYDIDNIIIPYSVAAQTRVEVLPYKEIPTPKWRIIDDEDDKSDVNTSQLNASQEEEDLTEETLIVMHEKALAEERRKFASYLKNPQTSRSRANRRIDSHVSSGTNTPINPTSPGVGTPNEAEPVPSPAYPSTPATPQEPSETSELSVVNALNQTVNVLTGKRERRRTSSMKMLQQQSTTVDTRSNTPELKEMIPPFEPRLFPIPDQLFEEMLLEMPQGLRDEDDFGDFEVSVSSSHPGSSKKHRRRARRSNNNNSISYATADEDGADIDDQIMAEERLDEETDDDNSVIHRLRLLERQYDEERMNNRADNSGAETESVDTQYVPDEEDEEEEEEDDDDDWYEPGRRR